MSFPEHEPTPKLEDFLRAYEANDNEWWYLSSGHHQNLFDAAVDRLLAARKLLDDWHVGPHPRTHAADCHKYHPDCLVVCLREALAGERT